MQRIDLDLGAPDAGAAALATATASRHTGRRGGRARRARLGPAAAGPGRVRGLLPPRRDPRPAAEAYDTVIIDTPPLLWVGDALTLSSQADGMIVVARLKALRRPMVRELRRILDGRAGLEARLRRHRPGLGEGGVYGQDAVRLRIRLHDQADPGSESRPEREKLGSVDERGRPSELARRGSAAGEGD